MTHLKWHPVSKFANPGVKLLVRTIDGNTQAAIRPNYAKSYKVDQDFRTLDSNVPIKEVIEWTIL